MTYKKMERANLAYPHSEGEHEKSSEHPLYRDRFLVERNISL